MYNLKNILMSDEATHQFSVKKMIYLSKLTTHMKCKHGIVLNASGR